MLSRALKPSKEMALMGDVPDNCRYFADAEILSDECEKVVLEDERSMSTIAEAISLSSSTISGL